MDKNLEAKLKKALLSLEALERNTTDPKRFSKETNKVRLLRALVEEQFEDENTRNTDRTAR
jgi:hypothetical protein